MDTITKTALAWLLTYGIHSTFLLGSGVRDHAKRNAVRSIVAISSGSLRSWARWSPRRRSSHLACVRWDHSRCAIHRCAAIATCAPSRPATVHADAIAPATR